MQVVITVKDSALSRLTKVAGAVRAAGLEDVKLLEAVGVITGRVTDPSLLDGLRGVEGVESVEAARTDIKVSDPDSPIT